MVSWPDTEKLPVFFDDEHYHLGEGTAPSNHIIKPVTENPDGTVENVAFCMALADRRPSVAEALKIRINPATRRQFWRR